MKNQIKNWLKIKSLKENENTIFNNKIVNENTTDFYDKHKLKKVVATAKINNFNHKNKIGKLKFNGINDLINNIKNNTISKALAKQKLDTLNKIKKNRNKK